MQTIVIYHGGCDDGFGSAVVAREFLGQSNVEYYPGVYQKDPPDVTGKVVYLVDFSYKRAVLEKMLDQCEKMIILDHHKTAKEDLEGLANHPQLDLYFDMERSGAGMTWDYFSPGTLRPEFVEYLEDRDLWKKKMPHSDEFVIALRSYPQEFSIWEEFLSDPDAVKHLIKEGHALQRYYRLRVEELKRHAYKAYIGGHICAITNAPYFAASEIAGELCDTEGAEFGACYFETSPGNYTYSLRSRADFDVSEIAKIFGGGGHKNASGFRSSGGIAHTYISVGC